MNRKSILLIVLLALVMVFAASGTALAGSGERDVPTSEQGGLAIVSGSTTFETKAVWVDNPVTGANYESFASYGSLPSGTNLSSVPVTVTYRGTQLLVDGASKQSGANGLHTWTGNLTLGSHLSEVVVRSSSPERTYFVSGLIAGSTFSATVTVDYHTATAFAALSPGQTYPTGSHPDFSMQPATAGQIATANNAVTTLGGYFASGTSYTFTNLLAGINTIDALQRFATAEAVPISGSSTYVNAIDGLAENSCGKVTYYGDTYDGGGWMYKVERGGVEVFPSISGSQWRVLPGDIVTWIYTCNWGDDVGHYMG